MNRRPVAVPEKIFGLSLSSIFSTAATRSAPFIRHRRRSHRSPPGYESWIRGVNWLCGGSQSRCSASIAPTRCRRTAQKHPCLSPQLPPRGHPPSQFLVNGWGNFREIPLAGETHGEIPTAKPPKQGTTAAPLRPQIPQFPKICVENQKEKLGLNSARSRLLPGREKQKSLGRLAIHLE